MTTTTIRVAIVDDHAIVRQGLRNLLTDMAMDVVGEASSGDEAVALAAETQPDVMLLDIRMKDCDGLTALPEIKKASPSTQVIMLTTYSNPAYFKEAVSNGASGYLLKDSEPEEIVDAIRSAASRSHLFDPKLLNMVVGQSSANHTPLNGELDDERPSTEPETSKVETQSHAVIDPISDREQDVLHLLAKGMSNAEIARELQVSVTTVKTHVTRILRKLDVNDRTQAVLVAIRNGLVS
jgi:RNA polymerase sigma factor (sigma-70 family)